MVSIINKINKGVCDNHKSKNKGVCNNCGVCRCCDTPPVYILKETTSVTKIKAYINLPKKVFQTRINKTFQRVNRRKEN